MMGFVTVFAIQALRFQRPDFNIGVAAEAGKSLQSVGIGDAFAYLPANKITTIADWVVKTPTFKHYQAAGLLKLYNAPPAEDRAAIEVAAAAAEASDAAAKKAALTEQLPPGPPTVPPPGGGKQNPPPGPPVPKQGK